MTSSELAVLVGTSSSNASYHLRTMAQAGLVEPAGLWEGREHPWSFVGAPRPSALTRLLSPRPQGSVTGCVLDLDVPLDLSGLTMLLAEFSRLATEVDQPRWARLIVYPHASSDGRQASAG